MCSHHHSDKWIDNLGRRPCKSKIPQKKPSEAIIPYSSGEGFSLTFPPALPTPVPSSNLVMIGMGNNGTDTNGTSITPLSVNFSFTAPKSLTLKGLSVDFTATSLPASGLETITISLYSATNASLTFTQIPSSIITLPNITVPVTFGDVNFNIPLNKGDRLLLVVNGSVTSSSGVTTTGLLSAGLRYLI